MITIYGIKNCDTVKKALKWAADNNLEFQFHDFRKSPLSDDTVARWLAATGAETLINKRGTTYRKLDDAKKETLEGENAVPLLVELPTLMKRPIFEVGGEYIVGFKEPQKEAVLGAAIAP